MTGSENLFWSSYQKGDGEVTGEELLVEKNA